MDTRHIDHSVYVDSDEQLNQLCQQWSESPLLALDTEFIRTDTFYPIAGLLQLSDGKGCFLIDPLAIDDFSALASLLEDPAIIKVLHSCGEDLEVFDCLFGVLPQPLFDTQIGAALAGMDFSMGYQRLTEELLHKHVPKGETRSNWLRRPLSESQKHYAALDVAYLPEIYQMLSDKLELLERYDWWAEDCQRLTDRFCDYLSPEQYYKKVKSAWKLGAAELALLQGLTAWREQQARQRDVPRGRIVKDKACFDIARSQPQSLNELSAIEDVQHSTVRKYGEAILELVKQGQAMAREDWPETLPRPLPPDTASVVKKFKALVLTRAAHLNMPQEMLARKKDYEHLVREKTLPVSLQGWRKAAIGDELLELVLV